MVNRRTIHHFGPDPEYVGGMGSVIRVFTEHQMGGGSVRSHPTWRPVAWLGSIPLALRAARHVLVARRHDVIHVHLAEDGSFVREGAIVLLARLLGHATVATIHGANFLEFTERHARLAGFVLRRADVITCLDPQVCSLVKALAPGVQVELLANPVLMDMDSPSAEETEEVVLFAGEVGFRKGADILCQAWNLVAAARPDARCIIVGPDGDFDVPQLDRLERLPATDTAGMRTLMRAARVVVLPSRAEGMPMVLTEAMGAGRPFVSTPVGGIPDLAREGGVLVAAGDAAGLARALTDFLAVPGLAGAVGERARRFCQETRSIDVIDERLGVLYQAAIGSS